MKVKDLIKKLQAFDPELPLLGWTEDIELLKENEFFKLLDFDTVSIVEGEAGRDPKTYKPSFKIGSTTTPRKYVVVDVSSDF